MLLTPLIIHQRTRLYRASPIDEWFHAAVAWKKSSKEVCLFIDGQEVGKASVPSYITFRDDFPLFYDIGHMRDLASESLKGYLRDLMIFGRDLTGNELSTMAGEELLTS